MKHVKEKKKSASDTRSTALAFYTEQYNEIESRTKKTLEQKKNKLQKVKETISKKENGKGKVEEMKNLRTELNTLTNEIKSLESNEELSEFLLNVHYAYSSTSTPKSTPTSTPIQNNEETNNINQFKSQHKKSSNKTGFLNELLATTGHGTRKTMTQQEMFMRSEYCPNCDKYDMEKCLLTSTMNCKECGYSSHNGHLSALADQNKEFMDHSSLVSRYRYKRKNYFEDHLNRFQSKENVTIPEELLKQIMRELHKRRINDVDKITYTLIKSILRQIRQTVYYDNIRKIICRLTGKRPQLLTTELEEKLKIMFDQMIVPFEKHKGMIKNRRNFFSYPYTIRKLLTIIAYQLDNPEIKKLKYEFKLPKSREKVLEQEKIFEKVCQELKWPFFNEL